MASVLSHPAVALGLYPFVRPHRLSGRALLLGIICADAPDLDSIGFHLGVPYGSLFGHRGFTHSLVAALLLAALFAHLAAGASASGRQVAIAGLYLFACTASHGLLDAMTTGGLGVAFFSPFSNQRFFFPLRPILVSPLGISSFLSARGLTILQSELVWIWLPAAALAVLGALVYRRSAGA